MQENFLVSVLFSWCYTVLPVGSWVQRSAVPVFPQTGEEDVYKSHRPGLQRSVMFMGALSTSPALGSICDYFCIFSDHSLPPLPWFPTTVWKLHNSLRSHNNVKNFCLLLSDYVGGSYLCHRQHSQCFS